MAINFGDTIMEGGIEPTARVQQPVQDNSGAVLAESLGGAAKAVGAIAGSLFQQGQQDANTKILTQYENDLLNIADAVDQEAMSRNEAMIQARALRRQYLANAPGLQDDFDTIWTDFAGANGLGHVVVTGTQEEQNRIAMETEAAKLGYTPDEFGLFTSRVRQATELNYQIKQAQDQGQLITDTQRLQGLQAVVGVAQSAYPSAQRQINEAMAAIQANPNNKQVIAEQLNSVMGNSIAQLKFMGGSADTAYIVGPIEQAMATFNQWVNGEVSNSVMEGELKNTQLKYDLMYATDPTLGPVIAASKMIGEIGMQNSQLFGQLFTPEVIQKFGDITHPTKTVNVVDDTDGSARTIEAIKTSAGMITPDSDPELITETRIGIEQMIDSAYVHERSAEGAMNFKDLVSALGTPEVSAFIAQHGISPKYAQQVVEVFKNNYENELIPIINREWNNVALIGDVPVSDIVKPRWNGNALEFVPSDAYVNNPAARQLANELNTGDNSMAIPINNLINTYANITGVDPKQIYEQDFAGRLFGRDVNGDPLEEVGITDRVNQTLDQTDATSDSFTLGDFNPDTLEPIEEFVSQSSGLNNNLPNLNPAYTDIEGINYDDYLPSIRASESGGNDAARNPSSTATGRYQFLKSTWNELASRYPNAGLTTDGRLDPQQQEVAIRLFTAENARYLKGVGVPLSNGTLYAAHFLGAGDAAKVLKASNGLVSDYVPAKVIRANPFLRGMSVSEFKSWANRKGNA